MITAILKGLFEMERRIDEHPLDRGVGRVGSAPSANFPGAWLGALMKASGFVMNPLVYVAHLQVRGGDGVGDGGVRWGSHFLFFS